MIKKEREEVIKEFLTKIRGEGYTKQEKLFLVKMAELAVNSDDDIEEILSPKEPPLEFKVAQSIISGAEGKSNRDTKIVGTMLILKKYRETLEETKWKS